MKQIIAGVAILVICGACNNKKANIDPFASITNEVDSRRNKIDSVFKKDRIDEPLPVEEDESFDDFVYRFASDDTLQRQRIVFPLSFYNEDKKMSIEKRFWKHDDLFVKQGYYTLLFDSEKDMELVEDTALNKVKVEFTYLKTRMMKTYLFQRNRGVWMLQQINLSNINKSEEDNFLDFFESFATDSLFQSHHVREPLNFVTTDPDDDFSILETTLDLNQWFAFKPTLPTDFLFNINYGQQNQPGSSVKIIALKGIGNGFSNILYFQRKDETWELYKFEDTSI